MAAHSLQRQFIKNGLLVPVRNVGALADAMERFILQPELIERMGRASRSIPEERFDVHEVVYRIYRVLNDARNKLNQSM